MMIHYLRVEDVNGKANDSTVPPLFFNEKKSLSVYRNVLELCGSAVGARFHPPLRHKLILQNTMIVNNY